MSRCLVNVQMCECVNVQMVVFVRCFYSAFNHLHIFPFSHLHIILPSTNAKEFFLLVGCEAIVARTMNFVKNFVHAFLLLF